jgi:hypothetical protein
MKVDVVDSIEIVVVPSIVIATAIRSGKENPTLLPIDPVLSASVVLAA